MAEPLNTEPTESEERVFDRDPEKDLENGLKAMQKALPAYEEAHRYYTGEECEKHLSKRLRFALSGSGNDFYINLAARVVRAVTDRLEIKTLDVTTGDKVQSVDVVSNEGSGSSGQDSAATRLNEDIWRDNELDQEAPDVHLKAGYYGDAYLFMWPTEDGEGLDIFVNSPVSARVFYDPQNPKVKTYSIKWWQTEDGYQRVDLYYDHYGIKFRSRSSRSTKKDGSKPSLTLTSRSFVRMTTEEDPSVDEYGVFENPLGHNPLWHFRTSRPYGVPLHKQAYGPQDAITKLIRSQMTVTDFAAFPQRWALGETGEGAEQDLDWGDDDSVAPDDLSSELTSGPGRVWVLKNFRSVGQFQEANVDQILKPLDKFIELMASVTGTPLTYLNKVRGTASTPLSGSAARELEASHINSVQAIQRSFGSTWRSMFNAGLEYLGETDAMVTVTWAPAYFRDDKETWDAVLSQQAAGVTKRYTLMQHFPEDLVTSWGFTEKEPNGPQEELEDEAFQQEQRKPVRPELKANNDGDTSRFGKDQKPTTSTAKAASDKAKQKK